MALTPAPAPSPPPPADAAGWRVVRLRVVWAFVVLGSLALASFGVVAFTLRSRGDESALLLMIEDLRHQVEHLGEAESRALSTGGTPGDALLDSLERRAERLDASRVQLDQRAASSPAFVRRALQEAVAATRLLGRLAREQEASLARHDTLSARGQRLASAHAHEQLDLILDRAVARLIDATRERQDAAQRFSGALLVVTLLSLGLLAWRSVLPAVRAARLALDEAARARLELTARVELFASQGERLAAQAAQLQRAQELTSGIIESAGEGILAVDMEQRFILWNPQMERFYGRRAPEVMGRTLAECFPHLAAGDVGSAYAKALAGEVVVVRAREITSADGSTTLVDATYRPLFDASGHVVGAVGKLRDVTEERRAAARLERLSAMAEQTSEGVLMTDASGRVLWANAAWERMTGWTLAELEGRPPWEVLRGDDSDRATGEAIGRSIEDGTSFRGEILNYRRDGSPYWVDISTTPIRDSEGTLTSFVAIERDVTAERERDRQLHAERAFAASLVESNSDGLFAVDEQLHITEWNPVMTRWSGVSREAALGRSIDRVLPLESPEHDRLRAARFRALFADGEPFSQERTYRFPSSERQITVETVVSPIRDKPSARVSGALCTVRDIAERHAAEQRFRLLFEHSADGHVLLDDDGLVDFNDAALRMLGYVDRELFLGRSLDALSPELQPDGRRSREKYEALRALAHREGAQRFDWSYLRQDGSELLVEVTLTAVPLPQGPGLLLAWHDVTARRAVEEAVRRERERLTDAIEALDAGLGMFDADLRLVTFNRTFARMRPPHAAGIAVGDTLRQLLERTAVDGRHPATGEAADTWIARTESRHRGPGGTFDERLANQVVRVSVSRTRDGGSVALLTDITELALIQRSLEAARDAEQHANHAKSAFLASMSHELRTPLNSIIGFTKQVRKNKGGHLLPTDVTYLERVERNAIQLLALINSLLDLSRIESGKQEVDLAPTELATLLRETVAQLEGQARPGVALRVEAPDEAPLLEIDGAKLRQVVINLVGNALKFTHNGSVTVRLRLGETGEPTAIEVEDTGIGIPHDRLEAIFQAFEQAERTTARDYGGTGLGLNISRSLCALIGARLEVTSVVGVGTTFRIGLGESPSERPAMPALAEPALTGL